MTAPINKSVYVFPGPTGPTGTFEAVRILSAFTGPTGTFPILNQLTRAQQAASPTGTFKSVYPLSGTGILGAVKSIIIPNYALFLDTFQGTAQLPGRLPDIGNPWAFDNGGGGTVSVAGGELTQTNAGFNTYSRSDTPAVIGEVGCIFRLTSVVNKMVVGGTPATGALLIVNIYPSRNANFYQVTYTLTGTDTVNSATANFAAAINANANSVSNGITATASSNIVSVTATECPKLATATTGGMTMSGSGTASPTLANFITGQNYLLGMNHFRFGVEGDLDWQKYISGATPYTSITKNSSFIGLKSGVLYTARCCITPPNVWGGLWDNTGTLLNAVWAQDTAIATYNGASCFFENGFDANLLFFDKVWAYAAPSISLSSIQAAIH